jgi:hypothetical protein
MATTNAINQYAPQAIFLACPAGSKNNTTGDGTVYTVACDYVQFNDNNDFNIGTYTFTASRPGIYRFDLTVLAQNITPIVYTSAYVGLVSTHATYYGNYINPGAMVAGSAAMDLSVSTCIQMAAGDTVYPIFMMSGSTKTINVLNIGNNNLRQTWMIGYLIQ